MLADANRRRLYEYVAGRPKPVGREEAAAETGTRRSLAAFHLDRLAAGGLLEVEYRRLGGRSGPGAGRPAKLYRKAESEVAASAPPRDYVLAADIFVDALTDAGAHDSIIAAARRRGRELGQHLAQTGADDMPTLMGMIGYAPVSDHDGSIRALNCPFHLLAQRNPELTCGMNVALLDSALEAAGIAGTVKLEPRPGHCCVAVSASAG